MNAALINDCLGFRDLKRAHNFDLRAAAVAAVEKYGPRHGAVAALASAGFWYRQLDGLDLLEIAIDLGMDPFEVADACNAISREWSDDFDERRAMQALAGRL